MISQTALYNNLNGGMSQGDKEEKFNVTCSRGISAPFLLDAHKEEKTKEHGEIRFLWICQRPGKFG